jgi:hypothetical protein
MATIRDDAHKAAHARVLGGLKRDLLGCFVTMALEMSRQRVGTVECANDMVGQWVVAQVVVHVGDPLWQHYRPSNVDRMSSI